MVEVLFCWSLRGKSTEKKSLSSRFMTWSRDLEKICHSLAYTHTHTHTHTHFIYITYIHTHMYMHTINVCT
jgi:hypothetical protein